MKIEFLKQDALDMLKQNVQNNLDRYMDKDNKWIAKMYGDEPFEKYHRDIKEFKLNMSFEKPTESDFDNIKIIYSAMKSVSRSEATDERLWAGLTHTIGWEYMQYRFKSEKERNNIGVHYFFTKGSKKSLITNTLSRLWWVGSLTYDESYEDPFELTKFFKQGLSTKLYTILSSNFCGNPKIMRALLSVFLELEEKDKPLGRGVYTSVISDLNIFGGICILDYIEEDELKDRIRNKTLEFLG